MNRYLRKYITEDLAEKMVFLGGPRQVGKTTLCQYILSTDFLSGRYYLWDNFDDKQKIEKQQFSADDQLLVFDELHKYPEWKNYIKGLYDIQKKQHRFLITGSARLDIYQKGGDSLLGRYHYYRLHPLSISEILENDFDGEAFLQTKMIDFTHAHTSQKKGQEILEKLMTTGGFPEPFFSKNIRNQMRWTQERKKRLVHEDIRNVSIIKMLSQLEKLVFLVPERIGNIFSLRSLQEDLSISLPTISAWIEILENFYYLFRIRPYHSNTVATIKKEPKVFLWDYSEIKNEGVRFENLVGSHLLKWVHFLQDVYGIDIELHYLRDSQQREVDFVITIENTPMFAIEVKLSDQTPSRHLRYFKEKFSIPFAYQIVKTEDVDFEKNEVRVMSAGKFLAALV